MPLAASTAACRALCAARANAVYACIVLCLLSAPDFPRVLTHPLLCSVPEHPQPRKGLAAQNHSEANPARRAGGCCRPAQAAAGRLLLRPGWPGLQLGVADGCCQQPAQPAAGCYSGEAQLAAWAGAAGSACSRRTWCASLSAALRKHLHHACLIPGAAVRSEHPRSSQPVSAALCCCCLPGWPCLLCCLLIICRARYMV